jgi:hypothetical protein
VATTPPAAESGPAQPAGSADIPQFFLPTTSKKGTYSPRLYGAATVQFKDRKRKVDQPRWVAFMVPLPAGTRTVDWDGAQPTSITPAQLLKQAPIEAPSLPLPTAATRLVSIGRWAKNFDRWLSRTQRLDATIKSDPQETVTLGPARGGISVELVAIVWVLE